MNRLGRKTALFGILALIFLAGSLSGKFFYAAGGDAKQAAAAGCDCEDAQAKEPAKNSGKTDTSCDGAICPLSQSEPDPGTDDPILWYAVKCPSSPVPWYGPYNTPPAKYCQDPCADCIQADNLMKDDKDSGDEEDEFHVHPNVARDGIPLRKRVPAADIGTHFRGGELKETGFIKFDHKTSTGADKVVYVQYFNVQYPGLVSPFKFGREIEKPVGVSFDPIKENKKKVGHVRRIKTTNGKSFHIITESKTSTDE